MNTVLYYKVQGHYNCYIKKGHMYHLLLVACFHISILHCVRDITTFPV